jgi:hypothetical protein
MSVGFILVVGRRLSKRELASDVAAAPRFADCIACLGNHLVAIIWRPYESC